MTYSGGSISCSPTGHRVTSPRLLSSVSREKDRIETPASISWPHLHTHLLCWQPSFLRTLSRAACTPPLRSCTPNLSARGFSPDAGPHQAATVCLLCLCCHCSVLTPPGSVTQACALATCVGSCPRTAAPPGSLPAPRVPPCLPTVGPATQGAHLCHRMAGVCQSPSESDSDPGPFRLLYLLLSFSQPQ